jgi:4-oxalomesaconate tautomerase
MGSGDVSSKVVPKMALMPPPAAGGHVCACSFIPHECHALISVLAAVTVATACVLPGRSGARVAQIPPGRERTLSVEHPTGEFSVVIAVCGMENSPVVEKARLLRTAASSPKAMPTFLRRSRFAQRPIETRPDILRHIVSRQT